MYCLYLTAIDVNECLVEALNNCSNSSHRECKDTPGSFLCPCKSGFEENDIDECEGELTLKAIQWNPFIKGNIDTYLVSANSCVTMCGHNQLTTSHTYIQM